MKQTLALILVVFALVAQTRADELAQGFATPPDSARPWVYTFCDNGNITSNSITTDLEAMQRVGIGGLLLMDVSHGAPKGPSDYGSPQWRAVFRHLCNEAARLGLQVNINNDAGWAGSGGPWITPELSMQKLTWSETFITGGKHFTGVLPSPPMLRNFYRDVAVLAFPSPSGDGAKMSDAQPRVTSNCDGTNLDLARLVDERPAQKIDLPLPQPGAPVWLQVEFPQPFQARTLQVSVLAQHDWWQLRLRGEVQVSDDGREFRKVASFTASPCAPSPEAAPWLQLQLSSTGVTAKFFRLIFTQYIPNNLVELKKLPLAKLELTPALRIEDIAGKSVTTPNYSASPPGADFREMLPEMVIPRDRVVNLTARMDATSTLTWDAPPGKWTVLRIGHTTTDKENAPAPLSGQGLECDKLSKAGIEAHFAGLMAKIVADNAPLVGKAFVRTHGDSWESGPQNWTPKFREEFQRLRGYDLLPLLPVITGRTVASTEVSERFLWDFRQTVSDLMVENYAKHLGTLAHRHGLELSYEAYGSPMNDLPYAGQADEPMAEFWWNTFGSGETCGRMASAAHVYGRNIIGAEAFTGAQTERWQGHPGNIKHLGDWAFCEGINRFVIHRYTLQPWSWPDCRPGLSAGPYGQQYARTQTWWEQSRAWHEYVARCQFLLRRGKFAADLLMLTPEGVHTAWKLPADVQTGRSERGGYDFDLCPPEALLSRAAVRDGKIFLPDGMNYRVLVLPDVETMTPPLLRKIKELADAGATMLGGANPPRKSPSLAGWPTCDAEVKQLGEELWRSGKIATGMTVTQLLAALGVPPDFASETPLRRIHRRDGEAEIYFVANPKPDAMETVCSFRVTGKQPELWWPDTGRTETVAVFAVTNGVTRLPLRLDPAGSVFVVFRQPAKAGEEVVSVTRNGAPLAGSEIIVVQKARYGLLDDPQRTRDVRAKVQSAVDAGRLIFNPADLATGDDPAPGKVKTLTVEYSCDGQPFTASAKDWQKINLQKQRSARRVADVWRQADGRLELLAWQPGKYELKTVAGKILRSEIASVAAPQEISGAWEVSFDPKWGGPAQVTFDQLADWSKRSEEGIKYYSGTAVYRKTFKVEQPASNRVLFLDLGKVAVMAEVKLNGKDLGILWKPPFQVEITDTVQAGENRLEIKVVNRWINRLIGDEQLPEDKWTTAGGGGWAQWLLNGQRSPAGRYTFTNYRLWQKTDALVESGLLGPVMLLSAEQNNLQ